MGVLDGQAVNASVTNPAFINKNVNDQMPNVLGLTNTFSPTISDIQAAANRLYTASGATDAGGTGTVYNATSGTISNGQNYQTSLGILANKFDAVTGHLHSGAPGDGPILNVVLGIAVTGGSPQTGEITLVGTGGLTITPATGGVFVFNSSGGGGGSGVSSIAVTGSTALTGAIVLQQGTGVQLTQSGQNILIGASGGVASSNPTYQRFLTAATGTYTLPSPAPKYIIVEIAGAGGGGGGGGTSGGSGGASLFGSSLLTANGGGGGSGTLSGGGGTASIGSGPLVIVEMPGGIGTFGSGFNLGNGGNGGENFLNGAGIGGLTGAGGGPAISNTGAGGGGGGGRVSAGSAGGGGAGAYIRAQIDTPASTYSFTVGAKGAGAAAGTVQPGGDGSDGVITVSEYY